MIMECQWMFAAFCFLNLLCLSLKANACSEDSFPMLPNTTRDCSTYSAVNVTCQYTCYSGFIFDDGKTRHSYNCFGNNTWTPSSLDQCLPYDEPSYKIEITIVYSISGGPHALACVANHDALLRGSAFRNRLASELEKQCTNILTVNDITVEDKVTSTVQTFLITSKLVAVISSSNTESAKQFCGNTLRYRINRGDMNNVFLYGSSVACDGNVAGTLSITSVIVPNPWTYCLHGAILKTTDIGNKCVSCPSGTYYLSGRCQSCPDGEYQDSTGQTQCKSCHYLLSLDKTACRELELVISGHESVLYEGDALNCQLPQDFTVMGHIRITWSCIGLGSNENSIVHVAGPHLTVDRHLNGKTCTCTLLQLVTNSTLVKTIPTSGTLSAYFMDLATIHRNRNSYYNNKEDILLGCTASGYPDSFVFNKWIHKLSSKTIRRINGSTTGNTTWLKIPNASYQDVGTYVCYADNTNGVRMKSLDIGITIYDQPVISNAAVYTAQTTERNTFAVVNVEFYSVPKPVKVEWLKNSKILKNSEKFKQNTHVANVSILVYGIMAIVEGYRAELLVKNLSAEDYGTYHFQTENQNGKAERDIIYYHGDKAEMSYFTIIAANIGIVLFVLVANAVIIIICLRRKGKDQPYINNEVNAGVKSMYETPVNNQTNHDYHELDSIQQTSQNTGNETGYSGSTYEAPVNNQTDNDYHDVGSIQQTSQNTEIYERVEETEYLN